MFKRFLDGLQLVEGELHRRKAILLAIVIVCRAQLTGAPADDSREEGSLTGILSITKHTGN
jgi:hypothetical protein